MKVSGNLNALEKNFVDLLTKKKCISDCYEISADLYRGKSLGTLNSYHHQVGGEVFAVSEYSLLIADFTFDGTANDAFFWAGATPRPGPQGFILSNEYGR